MKLLLIMPRFFNYPEVITDELKEMGYEVDFWDDRPSTNALVKAAIRINKNIIYKYIERYFNEIMKTVRTKKYDIIHFLRREMLDFTAFPVFFVSNLLLVQCKKYYFNRATVSRNCSIVL